MDVIETASMVELDDVVDNACLGETTVNTDEWNGYNRIGQRQGRVHRTRRSLGTQEHLGH